MAKIIRNNGLVKKIYNSKERFYNELKYRSKFSDSFYIPNIISRDEEKLTIYFEEILSPLLSESLNNFSLEDILRLFRKLPNENGKIISYSDFHFLKSAIPETPDYVLDSVIKDNGRLIHGDFRPQNIFDINSEFGLIDFENSKYGFHEKDLAYFYMELIYFNKDIGKLFLEEIRNKNNYPRFLFYCLYYCASSLNNPLSNKDGLKSSIKEILEEASKK